MKKCTLILGMLAVSSLSLTAQEPPPTPKVELSAAYSFVHASRARDLTGINLNGGSGTAVYNLNSYVGMVADLGAYHNGSNSVFPNNDTTFTYLFGPRFSWRKSRFVPYGQFLFGGARLTGNVVETDKNVHEHTANAFATSAGGGLDIVLTKYIALKPIQVEYLMTQLPEFLSDHASHQNDLRYSAGVVFRFGTR